MWALGKSKTHSTDPRRCNFSFEQLCGLADEELLLHLDHSQADAVAVLYQRYRRLVFGVAFRILHDRGEAEDVVQNVFVDLFNTTLRFDPARGTGRIWILQFAYSRSFRRRQQLTSRRFYSTVDISEIEDSLVASTSSARVVEDSHAISNALTALAEPQKRVMQLASEGHTLRDIAELTGEKLANVRHHYYRGLAKLRAQFGLASVHSSRQTKEAADVTT